MVLKVSPIINRSGKNKCIHFSKLFQKKKLEIVYLKIIFEGFASNKKFALVFFHDI